MLRQLQKVGWYLFTHIYILTDWAPKPIQSRGLDVRLCVCPIARNCQLRPNGLSLRFLVKERIPNIGIPLENCWFLQF